MNKFAFLKEHIDTHHMELHFTAYSLFIEASVVSAAIEDEDGEVLAIQCGKDEDQLEFRIYPNQDIILTSRFGCLAFEIRHEGISQGVLVIQGPKSQLDAAYNEFKKQEANQ